LLHPLLQRKIRAETPVRNERTPRVQDDSGNHWQSDNFLFLATVVSILRESRAAGFCEKLVSCSQQRGPAEKFLLRGSGLQSLLTPPLIPGCIDMSVLLFRKRATEAEEQAGPGAHSGMSNARG
jgi:hypothetical protein